MYQCSRSKAATWARKESYDFEKSYCRLVIFSHTHRQKCKTTSVGNTKSSNVGSVVTIFTHNLLHLHLDFAASEQQRSYSLTAGLPGLARSFLSSAFFPEFSGRWRGEPSDLEEAIGRRRWNRQFLFFLIWGDYSVFRERTHSEPWTSLQNHSENQPEN